MGVLVVVWINSGIDSLIRCSAIKLISKMGESQEIGLVPFVVVHGCFWGMFCNSGLIQEYPIRFNLDRRTSSHYALCSEIYICYKALCHTSAYGIDNLKVFIKEELL